MRTVLWILTGVGAAVTYLSASFAQIITSMTPVSYLFGAVTLVCAALAIFMGAPSDAQTPAQREVAATERQQIANEDGQVPLPPDAPRG